MKPWKRPRKSHDAWRKRRRRNPGRLHRQRAGVKIERAIATKAELIATDKGLDLSAYLSDVLRARVDADWLKMIRRVDPGQGEG